MKWFHHECAARHDPKLQTLGATFGAEGLGIYWGLLEEIGEHSDTFHVKISGISEEADKRFAQLVGGSRLPERDSFRSTLDMEKIPRIPLRILARVLFTTPRKLKTMIETCIEVGLFEAVKWREYNVLHSPSFEHRADDYTRRQQRKTDTQRSASIGSPDGVRTLSGQTPEFVRTKSASVPPEQTTENREESEEENRRPKQEHLLLAVDSQGKINLEAHPGRIVGSDSYLIEPTEEDFRSYCRRCADILRKWNEAHTNAFSWSPGESELRKLFYGGDREHKTRMCYQAYNLLGETINYPELVLRAVSLMLRSSVKHRIVNPLGWLWSCLHGNGDGTTPWVQLITADEEKTGSRKSLRPP